MDCEHARLMMPYARLGVAELEAGEIARLESHLADCGDCRDHQRADRRFDEQVAQAMQVVHPPADFRNQLLSRLKHQRQSWYRTWAVRLSVPAAAVVAGWMLYPAPRFDADAVVDASAARIGNRDAADAWLQRIDRRFAYPPKFRAKYLVGYERRSFGGLQVPMLEFVRGGSLARVAILTDGQFRNLGAMPTGPAAGNSFSTVLVERDSAVPGVVFLIEVLNGPVDPFYNDDDPNVT